MYDPGLVFPNPKLSRSNAECLARCLYESLGDNLDQTICIADQEDCIRFGLHVAYACAHAKNPPLDVCGWFHAGVNGDGSAFAGKRMIIITEQIRDHDDLARLQAMANAITGNGGIVLGIGTVTVVREVSKDVLSITVCSVEEVGAA